MIKGQILVNGGFTATGIWEYSAKTDKMELRKGKGTFPNGDSSEGLWEYNEELKCIVLIEGICTRKSMTFEGKFQYIPQLKDMKVNLCLIFSTL